MRWIRAIAALFTGLFARYEGAQWDVGRSRIPGAVQSDRFDASEGTRHQLQLRARYFEKNDALFNKLADLFCSHVVGGNVQVLPASSDRDWNERAKTWWDDWGKFCDLNSRQGFARFMARAVRLWFVDGESFILKTRSANTGRARLQLIESHLVATPPDLASLEGDSIIDGVQIDPSGRPTGYYIAEEDGNGQRTYHLKSAEMVIHLFEPTRAAQYRGRPFVTPVINDLHDLSDLQMLEMKAAKDAAEITNVIKTPSGEVSSLDKRRGALVSNTRTLKTGESVTAAQTKHDYYQETAGGRTVVMQTGDELSQFKSDRPSVATSDYWRYLTERICAGVGIPVVLVFPSSMQGTVYRGALDMADAFFKSRFQVVAAAIQQIFEFAIRDARTDRRTKLADGPADWYRVSVHPPRAVNVDVGRNATAMLKQLEVGAVTYDMIYGPLGLDWREQMRRLKEQEEYAAQLGLDLNRAGKAAPAKLEETHEQEAEQSVV